MIRYWKRMNSSKAELNSSSFQEKDQIILEAEAQGGLPEKIA